MRFFDENRIPGMMKMLRPMLASQLDDQLGDIYEEMIRNWEAGQNVKGEAWAPLAESTIRDKGHGRPLIHTRQMIKSADYNVDRKNINGQIVIDSEYAAVHEFGAPDQGIPPRPVLQPTIDVFNEEAGQLVGRAIDRAYVGASASGLASHFGTGGGLSGLTSKGARR